MGGIKSRVTRLEKKVTPTADSDVILASWVEFVLQIKPEGPAGDSWDVMAEAKFLAQCGKTAAEILFAPRPPAPVLPGPTRPELPPRGLPPSRWGEFKNGMKKPDIHAVT
jgi:hypothetical protein